jgi:chemotaxis receptor (MCP) glutamine deamidase CheD
MMAILGCMLGWSVSMMEMMVNKMAMLGCTHHSKEPTLSSKMNGGSKITCK